ncbi:unnamed protein product [Rhizoctonia solani]|uniref:Uncharacterized protein n=1 Tax=Rhizoctonia solani TaxID=456999 RepID=A0A8H3CSN3_9AGAM|nr:unnamed protein product [Rhizoctonia solani]
MSSSLGLEMWKDGLPVKNENESAKKSSKPSPLKSNEITDKPNEPTLLAKDRARKNMHPPRPLTPEPEPKETGSQEDKLYIGFLTKSFCVYVIMYVSFVANLQLSRTNAI